MSDHASDLAGAVGGPLKTRQPDGSAAPGGLDAGLWDELAALGFTGLTVPAELGGSGGDLRDAAVVVAQAARFSAPVPLAEAMFLAGPLLAAAGIELPPGVVTSGGTLPAAGRHVSGPADDHPGNPVTAADGRLTGTIPSVPWLRSAGHVVTLAETGDGPAVALVAVGAEGLRIEAGENLAGEHRDTAVLADVTPVRLVPLPPGRLVFPFELYGAAARAVQLGGAAGAVLDLSVAHVRQRVQFGRPLARFQAVQQILARLAADATTVTVAADAAVDALTRQSPDAGLLVAAAKAQASRLATAIGAAGHQLHGAIGYTMEHQLGAHTKRLWSWRQECGNELYWERRISGLADEAGAGLWELITRR